MSTLELAATPEIPEIDEASSTLKLKEITDKVREHQTIDRNNLLNQLADNLTINEATSLISRIQERKRVNSGMSKGKRFGLYPIEDWSAFERTKRLESSFWMADIVFKYIHFYVS